MSMSLVLNPLDDVSLARIAKEPSVASEILNAFLDSQFASTGGGDATAQGGLSLDKNWHAIHFLLSGSAWDTRHPGGMLLAGGAPVPGEDTGYGPPRILSAAEVTTLRDHLATRPPEALLAEFDFEKMAEAEIYPSVWDPRDTLARDLVLQSIEALRSFIDDAAAKGHAVLISMF